MLKLFYLLCFTFTCTLLNLTSILEGNKPSYLYTQIFDQVIFAIPDSWTRRKFGTGFIARANQPRPQMWLAAICLCLWFSFSIEAACIMCLYRIAVVMVLASGKIRDILLAALWSRSSGEVFQQYCMIGNLLLFCKIKWHISKKDITTLACLDFLSQVWNFFSGWHYYYWVSGIHTNASEKSKTTKLL
jgi:hypothetical protein